MAAPQSPKLLDVLHVSPRPASVPPTTLPLTFFDVFWIGVPPIQRLLFYQLDTTTTHFTDVLLPKIKHSLALSLQFFFSFAGNIHLSHSDGKHEILYVDGDSVSVSVAESDGDFHKLVDYNPKGANEVRPFLPKLPPPALLALQFTIFPDSGIVIGISMYHAVADGRSLAYFMKFWSSICRTGREDTSMIPPPCYDRTTLQKHDWLKTVILEQMADTAQIYRNLDSDDHLPSFPTPELRATFVLSRADIDLLRRRVLDRVEESEKPFRCSTFVLACSYVWICLLKSRRGEAFGDGNEYFAFAADSRSRLDPPLPSQYFGNCVSCCFAAAKTIDLARDEGLLAATKAMRKAIQVLDEEGPLKGLENCIPKFMEQKKKRPISVAGSPQFRVYDIDFGWGRPKKTEVISIDVTGAIYVGDSRAEEGGIEIGVSLSEQEMGSFASLFQEGLKTGS